MKKRIFILFITLSLMLSALSCSDTPVQTETKEDAVQESSVPTETEIKVEVLDNLPEDLDFEGRDIRFIVEEASGGNLAELSVFIEEESAELVPSAVYHRNLTISDRLGVNIVLSEVTPSGQLTGPVRNSVNSNSDDYDVVSAHQYNSIHLAPEGLMMNLANFEYLDFDREYWAGDFIQNMGYLNVLPWATGDAALRYIGGMYATFVNADIWNKNYSDVNLYDIVNEGEWTLDKMRELSEGVYIDANGDGARDKEDIFGLAVSFEDPMEGFAAASNVKFSETGDDGLPTITLDNERTYMFYDKMYALLITNPGFFAAERDDNHTTMTMFKNEHSMFCVNKIFQSEFYLRDMDVDFMIVPVPKLDTDQAEYNTRTHDGMSIYGIPVTNKNLDSTTATLEALASESYKTVTPAYYETALKVRYTRDSESGQMIELIRKNVSSDFASMYSAHIADIVHTFRGSLSSGKESIASTMQKAVKLWELKLNDIISKIESVEN